LREAEAGARRRELGRLLAKSHGGQGKGAKSGCYGCARLHRQAGLLNKTDLWARETLTAAHG
jgi:hypothetical protein